MTAVLFSLLLLGAPNPTSTLAVFPPDASTSAPDTIWVGEAVADALPRALVILGSPVVERSDRLIVEEALGIPGVSLTRATCIRLGEALGASRLIVGSYEIADGQLKLSLRLLDVERGTLSAPFVSTGAVEKILDAIYGLAWDIALSSPTPPALTRTDYMARIPAVPFEAFRTYAQGLTATDAKNRLKLLRRSLSLGPRFDGARVALGRLHLQAKEYEEAEKAFAQVKAPSAFAREATFLDGVALLGLGRYKDAAALYAALAVANASPAVLNNEGIALFRLGEKGSDPLKKAVELAPGAKDLVFNLGWSLLREDEAEAAVFWLKGVVREDARDTNARLLLVWALERAKRDEEASEEWKGLMERAPSLATFANVDFGRRFERILPSERLVLLDEDRRSDVELAEGCMARAEKLLQTDAEGALRELVRAETLDPYGPRVHQRMATLLAARGDKPHAVEELRTSLWCKEDIGVRIELMVLLKDLGRSEEAKGQAARILKDQPTNEAALKLLPPS